jgi:hypothetical protein
MYSVKLLSSVWEPDIQNARLHTNLIVILEVVFQWLETSALYSEYPGFKPRMWCTIFHSSLGVYGTVPETGP